MRFVFIVVAMVAVSATAVGCDEAGLRAAESVAAIRGHAKKAPTRPKLEAPAQPVEEAKPISGRASATQCDEAIANITRLAFAEAQTRIPPGLAPAARKQALRNATKGIRDSEAELKEACRQNMSPNEARCTAKAGSMADLVTCDAKDASTQT